MKYMKVVLITMLWGSISGVDAGIITLDTSTLPSMQGWEYVTSGIHSGVLETNLFSVSGSVLTMDNMDEPVNWSGGGAEYRLSGIVEYSQDTTFEWTSRTTEFEKVASGHDYGFFMGFSDGQYRYRVGISDSLITLDNGTGNNQTLSIDATEYHTYRIETMAGQQAYDFYIDNIMQATLMGASTTENWLRFGDTTSTANARADITELKLTQIPEPSSIVLLGFAGGLTFFVRRRFRR